MVGNPEVISTVVWNWPIILDIRLLAV